MDLSPIWDVVAGLGTLAKEIGKGGGGSTEEPAVCFALLPVGIGVLYVGLRRLLDILREPGGRAAAPAFEPERKVQTA